MNALPKHVTIKLYREAYRALYDEIKLLEAAETDRYQASTSAKTYFWSQKYGYHLRCLYAGLLGHAWKRPDELLLRPGKPASIRFAFPVALTLYGHLGTLGLPPQHPIQSIIDALDAALVNLVPYQPEDWQLMAPTHIVYVPLPDRDRIGGPTGSPKLLHH